eukprot:ANDGO_07380.mRNA.1 hypothetical protein EMIHUDRAFT_124914
MPSAMQDEHGQPCGAADASANCAAHESIAECAPASASASAPAPSHAGKQHADGHGDDEDGGDGGESAGEVSLQQEEQQQHRSGCCCARGGCCRQAPPKVLVYANGELKRVNVLYKAVGCFSNSGTGLEPQIPDELFENGLTPEVFEEWAAKLEDIRAIRVSGCGQLARCMLFLVALPCFCRRECGKMRANIEEWDSAFRNWQSDFNTEVLEALGMFVKTQSKCDVFYDRNGKHRIVERWLAFAMNPTDAEILRAEPHLAGDIESGCCGGPNEHELCMHP